MIQLVWGNKRILGDPLLQCLFSNPKPCTFRRLYSSPIFAELLRSESIDSELCLESGRDSGSEQKQELGTGLAVELGDGRFTATTVTGTSKVFWKPIKGICSCTGMGTAICGLDISRAIGRSGLNPLSQNSSWVKMKPNDKLKTESIIVLISDLLTKTTLSPPS